MIILPDFKFQDKLATEVAWVILDPRVTKENQEDQGHPVYQE